MHPLRRHLLGVVSKYIGVARRGWWRILVECRRRHAVTILRELGAKLIGISLPKTISAVNSDAVTSVAPEHHAFCISFTSCGRITVVRLRHWRFRILHKRCHTLTPSRFATRRMRPMYARSKVMMRK